jgi:Protein of unknown function (DUF559)
MPNVSPEPKPSTTAALDRHALLRERGLPTLSVLVGSRVPTASAWRRWAAGHGQALQTHQSAEPRTVVRACVAELARGHDLQRRSVELLAEQCGRNPSDLQAELAGKTLHGLDQLLRTLPPDHRNTGAGTIARRLCRAIVEDDRTPPEDLAAALDAELEGHRRPHWRVLTAIDGLLAPGLRPALLFAPPADISPVQWLSAESRRLAELAESVPTWHIAIAIGETDFEAYRHGAPETRVKALLTGGVVHVLTPDAAAIAGRLRDSGVDPAALDGPVRRLAAERVPAEVVDAFATAAFQHASVACTTEAGTAREPAREDAARSAAERFLFEMLDALPATAGRFTLNAKLGFPFGGRAAEIDLCAGSMRLAVEVDGYHHFTDPNAYRRDRRKDWELQRHGYVVLRVLAADVVERMEDVLDRILAAVDHCRGPTGPTPQGGDVRRDRDRPH